MITEDYSEYPCSRVDVEPTTGKLHVALAQTDAKTILRVVN